MGRLPVDLHPMAVIEAGEAREWYEERHEDVGAAFLDELRTAMDDIEKSPARWPVYLYGTRQKLFQRFPYIVVYRELPHAIQVIAVAHGRRKPGYWKDRLESDD